jgi:hypothetical protein
MAPAPWRVRAAERLLSPAAAADALPAPAGLLLGAVDAGGRSITLLGATPIAAAAPAKELEEQAGGGPRHTIWIG